MNFIVYGLALDRAIDLYGISNKIHSAERVAEKYARGRLEFYTS